MYLLILVYTFLFYTRQMGFFEKWKYAFPRHCSFSLIEEFRFMSKYIIIVISLLSVGYFFSQCDLALEGERKEDCGAALI